MDIQWLEGGRLLLTVVSLIIAGSVGWVGFMQWRTNADKLRLDLYNRRFEIYSATIDFYQVILDTKTLVGGMTTDQVLLRFIKAKQESQFLFDPESGIFQMLTKAFNAYFVIKGSRDEFTNMARADSKAAVEMHKNATAKQMEISLMIFELDKALAPYLNYHTASGTKIKWPWLKS